MQMTNDLLAEIKDPSLYSQPIDSLRALARRLRREWDTVKDQGTFIRIAVLSGFTSDYLVDVLRLALFRRGLSAEFIVAGYGQLIPEVLGKGRALSSDPDLVLFLPTFRDLRQVPGLGATREESTQAADAEAGFWSDLVGKIDSPVIMLSFDQPPHRSLGELEGFSPAGLGGHARRTNHLLFERLPASAALVDAEALQSRLGRDWHDEYLYTLCKQPFAMRALPEVADTLAAAVCAKRGRAKKVLVLDLDNTLWGGVVGDIGLANLELGRETPEGEAFSSFQEYLVKLAERGVILALCSKNNEEIAWSGFRNHPAMVLKEVHVAAFSINFEEKATNIRNIAKSLNVGLDALVFVDDNPVERAWVHSQVPEVAVVDLPENPARYADAVEAANLFPMVALTQEDLRRTQSYRAMAVAKAAGNQAVDLDSFLRDLEPKLTIEAVDEGSIDRIVQLIGKTNQFKLNPALFDNQAIISNAGGVVALRLADRLQDYGIVAVAVTRLDNGKLDVLNWVMSCRVFGRRLEHAMVNVLRSLAAKLGAGEIVLTYKPSPKNGEVPTNLAAVGFVEGAEGGEWRLHNGAPMQPHYMTIEDRRPN